MEKKIKIHPNIATEFHFAYHPAEKAESGNTIKGLTEKNGKNDLEVYELEYLKNSMRLHFLYQKYYKRYIKVISMKRTEEEVKKLDNFYHFLLFMSKEKNMETLWKDEQILPTAFTGMENLLCVSHPSKANIVANFVKTKEINEQKFLLSILNQIDNEKAKALEVIKDAKVLEGNIYSTVLKTKEELEEQKYILNILRRMDYGVFKAARVLKNPKMIEGNIHSTVLKTKEEIKAQQFLFSILEEVDKGMAEPTLVFKKAGISEDEMYSTVLKTKGADRRVKRALIARLTKDQLMPTEKDIFYILSLLEIEDYPLEKTVNILGITKQLIVNYICTPFMQQGISSLQSIRKYIVSVPDKKLMYPPVLYARILQWAQVTKENEYRLLFPDIPYAQMRKMIYGENENQHYQKKVYLPQLPTQLEKEEATDSYQKKMCLPRM
ncbi:MAG: hypothetical protein PHN72_02015 [Bacilli bacterium]|nr:hypothetical protein [Bacilli bacterium]